MSAQNGTVTQRKTLSSQLDRLDGILDCLGDGLNEAVRDAVKDAVGEAVRLSVRETLQGLIEEITRNPEVITTIRTFFLPSDPAPTPTAEPGSTTENVIESACSRGWSARLWAWLGGKLVASWGRAKAVTDSLWQIVKLSWTHRRTVGSLSGVAASVGIGSYWAGHIFSAVLAGIGGAALGVLLIGGLALWSIYSEVDGLAAATPR